MSKHMICLMSLCLCLVMSAIFPAGTGAAETEDGALLRMIHASPDTPAADVYVNKDKVISGMAFKEVSEYLPLEEGSYDIQIFPAGSKPKKVEPVLEENVTVMQGEAYSFAVSGKLDNLSLEEFQDDLTAVEDEAKLRIIHLSPDAPAVDVVSGDTDIVKGLAFPEASAYEAFPEGSYTLDILPEGKTEAIFNIPNVELKQGENYTAVAVGLLKGDPAFDVILAKDN